LGRVNARLAVVAGLALVVLSVAVISVRAVPTSVTATTAPPTSPASIATGAITGTFGYPSDFVPPATVYAISTTDPGVWYSVDFPGFGNFGNPPRPTLPPGETRPRYTITGVAPGAYWVVAYRNDGQNPDPGYYCGPTPPSGPCPDLKLAAVTVIAGETTSGIDVFTWVPLSLRPPSPTMPSRPTQH
jgi:hypothetical protein